jgi:hypothetical protein
VNKTPSKFFCFKLLKIVPTFKTKKVTDTFLLQSKHQIREISHSTRAERSSTLGSNSRVSGTKRDRSKKSTQRVVAIASPA